jgi:vitamin B12 transporter
MTRYTAAEFHYPTDYTGTPSDSNAYNTQHRLVVGLDASRYLLPNVQLHVIGAANEIHDFSEDLTASTAGGTTTYNQSLAPAKGFRRSGEVCVNTFLSPMATLTVGGQYEKEYQQTENTTNSYTAATGVSGGSKSTTSMANDRITRGYYGALQGTLHPMLSYDVSARYDDHSDYKNISTYHAGVNVGLLWKTRLRVTYGTAFNAPSFAQSQGSAYNGPNAQLQPEQAHTLDASLEAGLFDGRVRASVGAFDQHFSQLIQYVSAVTSGPPDYTVITPAYYSNLTQARAKGFEGELHAILIDHLTAAASYTQTIAQVYKVSPAYAGSSSPGDALLRRPSHIGSLNLAYALPNLGSAAITTSYVGKRADVDFSQFPSPTVTLPSYVKVDASVAADLLHTPQYTVAATGRVENLFDKQYEEVLHYRAPGRAVFVGLRVSTGR